MESGQVRQLRSKTVAYIHRCRLKPNSYAFASYHGGRETLYASAFAVMILQTVGQLPTLSAAERRAWADYLNRWQDPETGRYLGPEIAPDELLNPEHDWDLVTMHLTAHVLPALSLLGSGTTYPLSFAHNFLDLDYLHKWLESRDWRHAWREGNNLIAVAQFLIWLRDREGLAEAQDALDMFFAWLDNQIDPSTGLWGTDYGCPPLLAMYGAYHQLLAYYFENRPIPYPERLIDTVLSLQHPDGGFHPAGGGGACEDTDGIDILVNLYKRVDYKRPCIRRALRRAIPNLLSKQLPDGGFAYRLNEPFIHLGIRRTQTPPNVSNLFPTWFRLHSLALIAEVLTDHSISQLSWGFNDTCSMGWHRPWDKNTRQLSAADRLAERLCDPRGDARRIKRAISRMGRRKIKQLMQRA